MDYKILKNKDKSIELDVVLKSEEFREYFDGVVAHKINEVEVKGFRKGNVPKEIALKYIDIDKAFNESGERAIKGSLKKINEENGWSLITPPEVKLVDDKENLHYKATIVTFPEVTLNENWKKYVLESNEELKKDLDNIKVSDEETEKAVEWLLNSREENKDKKDIKLTDEMAQKIGDFKTADDLKKSIKEGILAEKKIREADKNRARIVDTLIQKSYFELPDLLVNKTLNNLKSDLKNSLTSNNMSFEDYVKKNYENEEKLDEALIKQAKKELGAHLVLDKVAKDLNIKVDDKEIEEEMNAIFAKQSEEVKKNINLQQLKDFSYGTIKNKKIFKALETLL